MTAKNVILTGPGRAGTTLTCHLLNKLPQVVALHEPMRPFTLAALAPQRRGDAVVTFFEAQRRSLLDRGWALSKSKAGKVPDNPIGPPDPSTGKRTNIEDGRRLVVDKHLDEDFTLCVKHPAMFTALLPQLVERFTCFALLRNPLAVLQSWNSISFPVTEGRLPAAEVLDPELKARLDALDDTLDRQLACLSWCFEMYARYLPDSVVRYEDVIASGGAALAPIDPSAAALHEPLESRNRNPMYDEAKWRRLGETLLASEGAYWEFYPRSDVESLLQVALQDQA